MAEKWEPFTAPPARAMADKRLSAEHHRVLQAVAAHYRFGRNGRACEAGHARLARLSACEVHSLSRSLKRLVELGYIALAKDPEPGKARAYAVIYDPEDAAIMKGETVSNPANGGVSNPAHGTGPGVSNGVCVNHSNHSDLSDNILGETYLIDSVKQKKDSAEAVLRNEESETEIDLTTELRTFAVVLPSGQLRRVGVRTPMPLFIDSENEMSVEIGQGA